MHKPRQLLVIVLLGTGACQQAPPVACHLTPERLMQQQRISMQDIQLEADTIAITSDASLCWQPLGAGDSLRYLPTFYKQPRQQAPRAAKVSAPQ
uniref:Lipoprotein n=1 Tax=Tanacetum cinerariifolium TaxID=118510 RepID=A0A699UHV1_TANCI|nr:hypothetical protein [Tanacetum cinerariifolium]